MDTISDYRVGDPDPTPDIGNDCPAEYQGGYLCTWPSGHASDLPHVAGTGLSIAAVWFDGEDGAS